jgi:hypothetical protein
MTKLVAGLIGASLLSAPIARAAVSAEEANQLGTTLTLVGAEKAGNKEGTIPEYTGGLTTPPAAFVKGSNVRPDPFADEKPLLSIDAKNLDQYADKLTEGTKALMKAHPSYRIDVYPTHRTAAFPKFVLENTVKNATRAKTTANGLGLEGVRAGIPFPIPKIGNEVMFNGVTAYQGQSYLFPKFTAYNVDSAGKLIMATQGSYFVDSPFYDEGSSNSDLLARARANYTGPARRAGEAAQTISPIDYTKKDRRGYAYLPGQRRVRLAPDIAYDTPNPTTSGMSTYDDLNLFNGALDRFDWALVGKKELYVPYNTYRFIYNDRPGDVFQPEFINPSVVRWELHRVWVVEGKLKAGKRHIYSRRTFYLDEDSWAFAAVDQYDGRGQLWRVGFSYMTQAYDANAVCIATTGHYDIIAGTYYINVWPGTNGVKIGKVQTDSFGAPDNRAAAGV